MLFGSCSDVDCFVQPITKLLSTKDSQSSIIKNVKMSQVQGVTSVVWHLSTGINFHCFSQKKLHFLPVSLQWVVGSLS